MSISNTRTSTISVFQDLNNSISTSLLHSLEDLARAHGRVVLGRADGRNLRGRQHPTALRPCSQTSGIPRATASYRRDGRTFATASVVKAPECVAVPPPAVRPRSDTGVYPVQDPGDLKERVWVGLDLPTRFSACTTRAASRDAGVALSPCRHFLGSVAPGLRRTDRPGPVVLGADLDLRGEGAASAEA